MFQFLVQRKRLIISIVIFLIIIILIITNKPSAIFIETDTGYKLRDFGIGWDKKTIFPLWLVCIWLSIIIYLVVCFYFSHYYNSLV